VPHEWLHLYASGQQESEISADIQKSFGFEVVVILRTPVELGQVKENLPFPGSDLKRVLVTFLSEEPDAPDRKLVEAARHDTEGVVYRGRENYLHCPGGHGKSKLPNSFLEKKLGAAPTTWNWNIVYKLYEMGRDAEK
jgi:uncharacterized protein (DUF1697 family)